MKPSNQKHRRVFDNLQNQQKKREFTKRKVGPISLLRVGIYALVCIISGTVVGLGMFSATPANATAGINQEMSFEGKIVTSAGQNIPDGTYNMEFRIYTGCTNEPTNSTGCTPVWTEDYLKNNSQGVTFTSGTYQVNLGSICAFTTSTCENNSNTAVNWNSYPLYLSLQIGNTSNCSVNNPGSSAFTADCGGDGVMNPFVLLTSTPYAFNSNEVGGFTASQLGQLATNQVWTGTNTIEATSTSAFMVENSTATTVALNVDTSNDRVAIGGNTSPTATLQVENPNSTTNIVDVQNSSNFDTLTVADSGKVTLGKAPGGAIGNGSVGTSGGSDYGLLTAQKFTTSSTGAGAISSMSVYIHTGVSAAPNNKGQMAIYTDTTSGCALSAADCPSTLVASTSQTALTGNSWNTMSISATLSANTTYWLAFWENDPSASDEGLVNPSNAGTPFVFGSATFAGSMPSSFPTLTFDNTSYDASIYATYANNGSQFTADPSANTITLGYNTGLILQGTTSTISDPQGYTGSEVFGAGSVSDTKATAIGDTTTAAYQGVAVGYGASAVSAGTAVGQGAWTSGTGAVALGYGANANTNGTALGVNASASADSIAIGTDATTTNTHQLVIGNSYSNGFYIQDAYIGSGVTDSSPQNVTLHATGATVGTSNLAGASLNLAGGIGTGSASGGNINLQIAAAGSSGSSANSLSSVATLSGANGSATFKNAVDSASGFQIQNSSSTSLLNVNTTNAQIGLGVATGGILGNNSLLTPDTSDDYTGLVVGAKFTTGASTENIASMSVYINSPVQSSPHNHFQVGIYTNSGSNAPQTYVASSSSTTITGNAWNTVPITASLTASTTYWLVYTTDTSTPGDNTLDVGSSGSANYAYGTYTYGSGGSNGMPTTFPSPTTTNHNISIYATYSGSGSALTVGSNGAIGIGTGSGDPTANLQVTTATNTTTALQVQNASGVAVLTADTTNGAVALGNAGSLNGALVFDNTSNNNTATLLSNATSSSYTMVMPAVGGTGTQCLQSTSGSTSTYTTLQFGSCSGASGINNQTTAQSANFYVQAATSGTVAGVLRANASGSGDILDLLNGSGTTVASVGSTGSAVFEASTNATSAFQVQNASGSAVLNVDTTNSKVGIGTTTPNSYSGELVVKSGTGAYGLTHTDGSISMSTWVGTARGLNGGFIGTDSANDLGFYASGGTYMALLQGGNVNIGRDNSGNMNVNSATLQVRGNSGSILKVTNTTASDFDVVSVAANGAATFENQTNSATAFQIQNAAGNNIFTIGTTNSNLVTNSGFDNNANNWSQKGTATISQDTSAGTAFSGIGALKAQLSATSSGMQTSTFTTTIAANTQYQLTFYAKCDTSDTTFTYGRQDVSGTDVNGSTTATCNTSWQQYTWHYTTGGTITSPNIYVHSGSGMGSGHTIWLDAISLVQTTTSAATNYQPGSVYLSGVIASPTTFENAANSTLAFQIQNSSGASELTIDTTNNEVIIGTGSTGEATAKVLVLDNGNTSSDPTGVAGAMYYNSSLGEFRCYGTTGWAPCSASPIDQSFNISDDFLSGNTTSFVGNDNWNIAVIGGSGGTFAYNQNVTGFAPSATHVGVLQMSNNSTTFAGTGNTILLGGSTLGSMFAAANQDIKATVGVDTIGTTGMDIRVGLGNETTAITRPTSGIWWEFDPAQDSGKWELCSNNNGTAACVDSGVTAAANTWYRLEIQITGSSAATGYINGTKVTSSNAIDTATNREAPEVSCYGAASAAATHHCYVDYYAIRGDIGSSR